MIGVTCGVVDEGGVKVSGANEVDNVEMVVISSHV